MSEYRRASLNHPISVGKWRIIARQLKRTVTPYHFPRKALQSTSYDEPSSYTYVEFDLDLGNALQYVVGFITHIGELLVRKPTNHHDLRTDLARTKARALL